MRSAPVLTIELVPKSSWHDNVRSKVVPSRWNRIRKRVYERAGHSCEACGGSYKGRPAECHEMWEFDLPTKTQRLVRLIALCNACHEVKHFGLAEIRGRAAAALRHLAVTNGWTPIQAMEYVREAGKLWVLRNQVIWKVDISALKQYEESRE
jgi:hypothetical protein